MRGPVCRQSPVRATRQRGSLTRTFPAMQDRTGVACASFPLSAAQLPLWLIDRRAGKRALQLRFDPAVLDAGSARTVLGAFGQLLASLAANPERSVASAAPPSPGWTLTWADANQPPGADGVII